MEVPVELYFTEGISAVNSYTTTGVENLWSDMESAGAVFLPVTGIRIGTDVSLVGTNGGSIGNYWSSTANDASNAYYLDITSGVLYPAGNAIREGGMSVRLVQYME